MNSFIINKETSADYKFSYFAQIRKFLSGLTCNYPHFEEWLEHVLDMTGTDERTIIICEHDKRIAGLAILKNTNDEKKICTIRVAEAYRRQGIGTFLINEARKILHEDYPLLTVSDEHIGVFRKFLSRFGFEQKSQVKSVYQYGHDEFYFNKPYQRECVLMSIKPKFAEKIMNGEKKVEFRKICFGDGIRRVYIYSSSPKKKIIGYFEVDRIVTASPTELWQYFQAWGGINRYDYDSYFKKKKFGHAILIKRAVRLRTEISLNDVMNRAYKAPQNYHNLDNVDALRRLHLLE